MELHLPRPDVILSIAKILSWFDRSLLVVWLSGGGERLGWMEYWLPRLVREGKLKVRKYGKGFIYTIAGNEDLNIEHGLRCSLLLTRFYHCDLTAEILTERYFKKHRGLGIVPDGGLVYPRWVLLWEYSTKDNCERLHVLRWKVGRYIKLAEARPNYQVVFVLDVPPEKLYPTIAKLTPHEALFYVDYQTFKSVPLGRQLVEPVYINGSDGQKYPLRIL